MIDQSANDYLTSGGGGAPGAKFEHVGDIVKGSVVSAETQQQTDMAGLPLTFNDGKPRMQLVITIQTDSSDDDDSGERRLFVRYKLKEAVVAALAGQPLEVGGTLAVQYTGEEKLSGGKTAKLYAAQYKPPVAQPGDLIGGTAHVDALTAGVAVADLLA